MCIAVKDISWPSKVTTHPRQSERGWPRTPVGNYCSLNNDHLNQVEETARWGGFGEFSSLLHCWGCRRHGQIAHAGYCLPVGARMHYRSWSRSQPRQNRDIV